MPDVILPQAQQYAERYTSAADALLEEVAAFTTAHHPKSHMLSGHLQGRFLAMVSHMIKPKFVLEIGTFTGYSALCLAEGLQPDGELHTLENRPDDAATAQAFFNRSPHKNTIHLHVGDAVMVLQTLVRPWDLVFLDAAKTEYITYFNQVFPNLAPNGFILADNVFFHGEVFDPPRGKNAVAVQAFNDFIDARTDVEKMMLPLRDGVYLIRKK